MPTISINSKRDGGIIRWDESDWLKGLVPHFASSQNLTYGNGLAYTTAMNPWRRPGYMMPGASPANATNASVVDGIMRNATVVSPYAYGVAGTKVHQLDLSNNTVTNGATFPHTITAHGGHSTVASENDIVSYYIGTTKYVFYSWNDGTDGDVGRYDLATTFSDSYMSTTAASGAVLKNKPHPMIVGDNNILYIGNGKDVASFQGQTGANGTFNSSAIDLPNDYVITSFAKTYNYLVIYAYKESAGGSFYRGESTAFFWDCSSPSFTLSYPLMGNYVNGGFSYNGTVGCFVNGRNPAVTFTKPSKMLLFNGTIFETIMAFPEDIPGNGGVEVGDDGVTFNAAGTIYQYGTPHIGFDKAINKISAGSGSTVGGMCKNLSSSTIFASTGTGTSGGIQYFNADFAQSAMFRTPIANPMAPYPSKFRIQYVKVYWGGLASGGNPFTMQLFYNRGTSTVTVIDSLTSVAATSLVTKYEADTSGNPFPLCEAIQVECTYGSGTVSNTPPFVQAIEVYFEYINN